MLFALLLLPAGIAGYVVGHYTSLGKSASTVVHTVTIKPATPIEHMLICVPRTLLLPGGPCRDNVLLGIPEEQYLFNFLTFEKEPF